MATHDVALRVGHAISLTSADSELEIKKDGKLLGRLKISQGGVDWIPSRSRTRYELNWSRFADALRDYGDERPK